MEHRFGDATSTAFAPQQTASARGWAGAVRRCFSAVERALEAERDQIPLWIPVGLTAGIAAWFVLPDRAAWLGFICVGLGLSAMAAMLPPGGRIRAMLVATGLTLAIGCLLVWGKATAIGAPPLARPVMTEFHARIEAVEAMPARGIDRVIALPVDRPDVPARVRLNIAEEDMPTGLVPGTIIAVRARLMPPAPPAVPGAYDFQRSAFFLGIGATGRVLPPIRVVTPAEEGAGPGIRQRLAAHVRTRMDQTPGGIAAAFATGDEGGISEVDAEAMRRSGLAHLLSISGVHVTALVGAVFFLTLRLLALSRRLALRLPLMLVAAAAGAAAGVGYTLLTGAEVPTIRTCVAALLVLAALAIGREALTLRLIAAGAIFVLIFWPEAAVGPSFQLSFAAVMAIVALHEHPRVRALLQHRDENWIRRAGRELLSLLMTGIAVELTLAPIALFHFHRSGLLGAGANLIAIPLTTFVIMPAEALALLFDAAGLGAPFWWVTEKAIDLLLWVAHVVAAQPNAVTLTPLFSGWVFALALSGLLWIALWRARWRWWGFAPLGLALAIMLTASPPDVLIAGDGHHLALRQADGRLALLRPKAGDYVRDTLAQSAGTDADFLALDSLAAARCNADFCLAEQDGKRILIGRGRDRVPWRALVEACADADVVVADRRLPRACQPKWLKLDRQALAQSGGVALYLEKKKAVTVRSAGDGHPWIVKRRSAPVTPHPAHNPAPQL